MNSFLLYGVSVKKDYILEHINKLKCLNVLNEVKILQGEDVFIVGMKPKEIKTFSSGNIQEIHEFDLAKTDFKQIEKKVLGLFSAENIPTDFFEFKLYAGMEQNQPAHYY